MDIYNTLTAIQNELKAPKNQWNDYGKYNYRSCEDILEGLKPTLKKYEVNLYLTDEIVVIGDRYYVKATARLTNKEGNIIENTAYAREALDQKGMASMQITGATSSYARKYALNGLFLIDDTKDADVTTKTEEQLNEEMIASVDKDLVPHGEGMTEQRIKRVHSELERTGVSIETILSAYSVKDIKDFTEEQYISCINRLLISKDKE